MSIPRAFRPSKARVNAIGRLRRARAGRLHHRRCARAGCSFLAEAPQRDRVDQRRCRLGQLARDCLLVLSTYPRTCRALADSWKYRTERLNAGSFFQVAVFTLVISTEIRIEVFKGLRVA